MSLQRLLKRVRAARRQARRFRNSSRPSAAIEQLESRALLTTNLTLFQHVVADSVHQDHAPEEAIDGIVSLESRWVSVNTSGPHWLEVQLQAPYPVGSAQVYLGNGWENHVADFEVQYHDGYQWQTAASVTGDSSTDHNLVFAHTIDTATRYRIYTTAEQLQVKEFVLLPPNSGNAHPLGTGVNLNLASRYVTEVTSTLGTNYPGNAVDGYVSDDSKWVPSDTSGPHQIELRFLQRQGVGSLHLYTGNSDGSNHLENFVVEFFHTSGEYRAIPPGSTVSSGSITNGVVTGATSGEVVINFGWSVSADRIRVSSADTNVIIREAVVLPPNDGVDYPIGTSVQFASPPTTQYTEFGDKWYQLVSRQNSQALVADENGASQSAASVAETHKYQLLYSYTLDAYRIRSKESGLALQVKEASQLAGAAIVEGEYSAAPHQLWRLEPTDNGHAQIVNVWSGMVLHANGSDPGVVTQQPFDAAANPANNVEWNVDFVENYFKKGTASRVNGRYGGSWWYNWGRGDFPEAPDDQFYAPMQWGPWNLDSLHQRHGDWNSEVKPSYYLGFNEPDSGSQSNMTVDRAIEIWPQLEALGVPLLSPSATQNTPGRNWHTEFTDRADALGYRQDYAGMHWYGGPNVNHILNYVNTISNIAHGRDVWITEFSPVDWSGGSGNWSEETNYNFILEFMYRADRKANLDKYSMFMWAGDQPATPWERSNPRANTFITDVGGELTPYGKAYAGWDGNSDPELDTLYIIHNRAATHRLQNDGSDDVGKASIRFDDTSVQWIVQDAGNDEVFITSPIDGRRLKLDNGNIVMSDPGATGWGVRWKIEQDQYGWQSVVHSGSGNHLRMNRSNDASGAPTAISLDVVAPGSAGTGANWWFVKPYQELGLTLNNTPIAEDGTATATVSTTLVTGVDTVVTLAVDDDSVVGVPASVTIPAGQSSVTFTVSAVDDDLVDGTQSTFMTADAVNFQHAIAAIDVTDNDVAELTLVITADEINENGGTSQATVTRNTDLASELVVVLSSSDISEATVPETVTIPAGATSVTFDVLGQNDTLVDGDQTVTITAAAADHVDATNTVSVTDDDLPELSLSINRNVVAEGGLVGSVDLLVPAYANPASNPQMWADLIFAAATHPVTVILNPNSGPGSSPIDPNYVNVDASGVAVDLDAANQTGGGRIIGYVATGFGNRDVNDVIADIDLWYEAAFWRGAGVLIDGIFFDEMSNDLAKVGYYQTLRDHVKAKNASDLVVSNPGTTFTHDSSSGASGSTVADYADSADVLVTYENSADEYRQNYTLPSWLDTQDASRFAHILHSEASTTSIPELLSLASDRKVGMFYVTDDQLYRELASYWTDTAVVTANLSAPSNLPVTVDFDLSGSATTDADYILSTSQIVIPPGATSASMTIVTSQDNVAEDHETIEVTVSQLTNATGDGAVRLTIADDDSASLTLSIVDGTISENGGETQATVSRNTDTSSALVVHLQSSDSSEAAVPASVTIPAGQALIDFSISAVDDDVSDEDQSIVITAAATDHVAASDSVVVTDDDVATLTFVFAQESIGESGGTVEATITRNTSTAEPLQIALSSGDSSEVVVPESVTIPSGEDSVTVEVTVIDDRIVDGHQSAVVAATADQHASANDTIQIIDDDVAELTMEISIDTISENGGITKATIFRNTDTSEELVLTLLSEDTSEAVVPETVTLAVGQASATFQVPGLQDGLVDGDQEILILASAEGFHSASVSIVVQDVDIPSLSLTIDSPSVAEDGHVVAVVRRNTPTANDLQVVLASSDEEEAVVPLTVTIPAGVSSVLFDVTGVDDEIADGDQTVVLSAASDGFLPGIGDIDVIDIGLPSRLVVTGPFGSIKNQRPLVEWTAIEDAVSYDLYINIDNGGGTVVRQLGLSDPSFQVPVDLEFARYRVFVEANFADGTTRYLDRGHTFVVEVATTVHRIGATIENRPTFLWERVPGASDYVIYINRPGAPVIEHVDDPGFGADVEHTIGVSLPANDYRLWVRPVRVVSGESFPGPWSDRSEFSTGGRTRLSRPSSGDVVPTAIPELQWDAVADAVSYEIYVARFQEPGVVYRDSGVTSPRIQSRVLPDGRYTAWIRTSRQDGSHVWGSGVSFSIQSEFEDFSVEPLAPDGPAFNTRPNFRWTSVEQATSYDVYLHNGVSSQMFANIEETVFRPQSSLANGIWEWSVRPVSEQGAGRWSLPVSFTTNGLTSLNRPESSNGQTLTFRWRPVTGAIRYVLQVDNLTTGEARVIREDELTTSFFTPDIILPPGRYRAWVRAIGMNNTSPWSRQVDFHINAT